MRASLLGTIWRREIRDILRDRRTLFATFVLPLLLYPALLLGFSSLSVSEERALRQRAMPIALFVGGQAVTVGEPETRPGESRSVGGLVARVLAHAPFVPVAGDDVASVETAVQALDAGRVALVADLPVDLPLQISRRQPVRLDVPFRSADPLSKAAYDAFNGVVAGWRDEGYAPLAVGGADRSSAPARGAFLFGGTIALLVVLMALTGAFHPALDLVAGEKERGTLDALLLSPASRRELVVGKYLTVLTMAVAASVANLGSMALTFQGLGRVIGAGRGNPFTVSLTPASFAVVLSALVLLSGLFSAAALALSTFARTLKEGQAYLTPLIVVTMPLAMVALMPTADLEQFALVPVANVTLLLKRQMTGAVPPVLVFKTLASVAALVAITLAWTVSLFDREDVLFREGSAPLFGRRAVGAARVAPSAGLAVMGVALAIALSFYFALPVQAHDLVGGTLLQMAFFAGVPLCLARLARVPLRAGLGLQDVPVRLLGAGVIGGIGALIVARGAHALQAVVAPAASTSTAYAGALDQLLAGGLPVALLVLAVAPAVAEELLFRGWLQAGLRSAVSAPAAVLATSAAFAFLHFDPSKYGATAAAGIVLGCLRAASRSIWPGVVAHALNNGVLVWLSFHLTDGSLPAWVVQAADLSVPLSGGAACGWLCAGGGVAAFAVWMARARVLAAPPAAG